MTHDSEANLAHRTSQGYRTYDRFECCYVVPTMSALGANQDDCWSERGLRPISIAAIVIRVLEHPDLVGVAQRARALVERDFSFERAVERWRVVPEKSMR